MQQQMADELTDLADKVKSILAAQNVLTTQVSGLVQPDLLPLPFPGGAGPAGYCQRDALGTKLQVNVYNQGSGSARASTTRVVFATTSGQQQIDLATPALPASSGSALVEFDIPASCTGAVPGNCDFHIGTDVGTLVVESNEANNNVAGTCYPFLF